MRKNFKARQKDASFEELQIIDFAHSEAKGRFDAIQNPEEAESRGKRRILTV